MTVTIIAEIGINHQRDLDTAKRMIDGVKTMGADIAKFQASVPYLETSGVAAPDHLAEIAALVPDEKFLRACAAHCAAADIEFLCTPAEEDSLKMLLDIGMRTIKVGSDNLVNPPFINAVAATKLPVFLSTGMAEAGEIRVTLERLDPGKVTLLHCVSAYPTPASQANVAAVGYLKTAFPMVEAVGYSDHTDSLTLPVLAMGFGAEVIEKHYTLDRKLPGPDHMASLPPFQFRAMVVMIREAERGLGDGVKRVQPCEEKNRVLMRKSVVASQPIAVGEILTPHNLAIKRPGTGLSPRLWDGLIGKRATRAYRVDEQL